MSDAGTDFLAGADLGLLAQRFNEACAHMLHAEQSTLRSNAFYAEAMRRALQDRRCGLMSVTEHERLVEQAVKRWRFNVDQVQRKNDWLTQENQRLRSEAVAEARREAAAMIRTSARTLSGKYRQDAARTIADWLDPQPRKEAS